MTAQEEHERFHAAHRMHRIYNERPQMSNPHRQSYAPPKERFKWRTLLIDIVLTLILAGALLALAMRYFDVVRVH